MTIERNAAVEAAQRYATLQNILDDRERAFKELKAAIEKEMEGLTGVLETFAEENPDEFKGKKSFKLMDVYLKYRSGTTVVLPPGKTWEDVAKIAQKLAGAKHLVKLTIDTKKISALSPEIHNKLGVKFITAENFSVSLNSN